MNWGIGFKRITLLLSIVVGLGCGILCGGIISGELNHEKWRYDDYQNDLTNISYFWSVWNANGWKAGKKGIIQHLLDGKKSYSNVRVSFTNHDGETFSLRPNDVFPGIDEDTLGMPPNALNQKCQEAQKQALEKIQNKIENIGFWGKRTYTEIVSVGVVTGVFVGAISFCGVWLVYLLLRWLVLGFCETPRKAEEDKD